jgi:hypothetical protein
MELNVYSDINPLIPKFPNPPLHYKTLYDQRSKQGSMAASHCLVFFGPNTFTDNDFLQPSKKKIE